MEDEARNRLERHFRVIASCKLRSREWICMDRYESEVIHQSGSKWEREIMGNTEASSILHSYIHVARMMTKS